MPGSRSVAVGLVQMACTEDPAANLEKALHLTRQAAAQGAQIVCLQELFRSPYFCKNEDYRHFSLAESVPGPSTEAFAAVAAEHGLVVIASLFEKRAEGLYHNTAAVLDGRRGYVGKYRKMHIPDDPLFQEKFYFTPGDLGFKAFDTTYGRVGVLICWDQWYPEAARLTALHGAEILFYPTAIGWLPSEGEALGRKQHEAWETTQRAHAISNGCFVVSVNRTGFEPAPPQAEDRGIHFWGQSFVAAPDGSVLARASTEEDEVLTVALDLSMVDDVRTHWPFFRDRRIDAYAGLTHRYLDEA